MAILRLCADCGAELALPHSMYCWFCSEIWDAEPDEDEED